MIDAPPSAEATTGARALRLGRLGPFLLLGQFAWALPGAASGTLLAAVLADTDPARKVAVFTTYAVAGAITSAVGTVAGGLLSDRTRSRLGRRSPWLLGSACLAAIALAATGFTTNQVLTGALYALFQLGIGVWAAALAALIPDHVPSGAVGRASAFAGFGFLAGQTAGGVLAGAWVTTPSAGLKIVPWLMVLVAVALAAGVRDNGERPARRRFQLRDLVPPASRDFWLAFAGRFLFILAILMITTFQLYLFTDFLGLPTGEAGRSVSLATLLVGVLAGVAVAGAGVLSDRFRRTKPFVLGAPLLLAIGLIPLLAAPGPVTAMVFFGIAGLTLGTYLSVDQALMVAVLPDPQTAARDLGVLSIGSTLPGVVAPIAGGILAGSAGYLAVFVTALVLAVAAAAVVLGIRSVK
ncbi:MFS transporter [Amycolatopsis acidicola]|uniref:MFS transporter n=1 Tax=Amycolatopsis acidicola TaxID=2596893 RepID=A0A5N0UMV9_9PSEU|nr:MFS transporter [Amycolatopsis acidicola]KAA9149142.1 MFS transporter [Amycolatopsis acidicola]